MNRGFVDQSKLLVIEKMEECILLSGENIQEELNPELYDYCVPLLSVGVGIISYAITTLIVEQEKMEDVMSLQKMMGMNFCLSLTVYNLLKCLPNGCIPEYDMWKHFHEISASNLYAFYKDYGIGCLGGVGTLMSVVGVRQLKYSPNWQSEVMIGMFMGWMVYSYVYFMVYPDEFCKFQHSC